MPASFDQQFLPLSLCLGGTALTYRLSGYANIRVSFIILGFAIWDQSRICYAYVKHVIMGILA